MKRNILSKLLVCSVILVGWGCKAKKPLVVNRPKVDSATTVVVDNAAVAKRAKFNEIKSRQTTFNTFSGRAKTKLNIDGKENDVTLNFRIQHNKKIWVSVTAIIGIEVARALITPDSIQVINRLQSVYIKKPFSFIYKYANPQLNYQSVEALLIGNAIPQLLNADSTFEPGANGTLALKGDFQNLLYRLLLGTDLRVNQTTLTNSKAAQSVQVSNSEFIQVGNRVIPSQINITSAVKSNRIQADLRYNKTEFDQPLDFSFSIPARFSPAD